MMQYGRFEGRVTKLLTEREVVELYGLKLGTLRNHRSKKIGIPFVKLQGKVRYRLSEIEAYIEKNLVQTQPIQPLE